MTIHIDASDMAEHELFEDDDMARSISERELIRANLAGKPATKIVARAVPYGEGIDRVWRAEFAVPGMIPDFSRTPEGTPIIYRSESDAASAAMAAAIYKFNSPRENLKSYGGSRIGNKKDGDIRPAKPTPQQLATWMATAGLTPHDLVFLFDKPARRILDWMNTADMPHPERLLLEMFARMDETVDLAFEVTNEAINDAEKQKGR